MHTYIHAYMHIDDFYIVNAISPSSLKTVSANVVVASLAALDKVNNNNKKNNHK